MFKFTINICNKAREISNECTKTLIDCCGSFSIAIGDLASKANQDIDGYQNWNNDNIDT